MLSLSNNLSDFSKRLLNLFPKATVETHYTHTSTENGVKTTTQKTTTTTDDEEGFAVRVGLGLGVLLVVVMM
jgi:hypothetical protein